jgi:hypothetical protein
MKARQKGKQNAKRQLEAKYLAEAREAIKAWGHRSYFMDVSQ